MKTRGTTAVCTVTLPVFPLYSIISLCSYFLCSGSPQLPDFGTPSSRHAFCIQDFDTPLGECCWMASAQHLSLLQKFVQFKELTFLISPASVVTLCMSPFSGFLAQGGSRFLYLTSVCSKNKRPEAKDFSTA